MATCLDFPTMWTLKCSVSVGLSVGTQAFHRNVLTVWMTLFSVLPGFLMVQLHTKFSPRGFLAAADGRFKLVYSDKWGGWVGKVDLMPIFRFSSLIHWSIIQARVQSDPAISPHPSPPILIDKPHHTHIHHYNPINMKQLTISFQGEFCGFITNINGSIKDN